MAARAIKTSSSSVSGARSFSDDIGSRYFRSLRGRVVVCGVVFELEGKG